LSQLRPPLGPSLLPYRLLSAPFSLRPSKGPISILSHTIPLFLFYYGPPPSICHWPASLPIVTHSKLVSPVHLDSYITSYLFARGSLIALMMEAVRTYETSVSIYLTTWQYSPEDSKLHTSRRENFKYHLELLIQDCATFSQASP
jgi:hypothetical protein